MKDIFISLSKGPTLILTEYSHNNGCYSAVFPSPKSKQYLLNLCHWFKFNIDPETLHVTVIYSKQPISQAQVIQSTFSAEVSEIVLWDNKNVVLLLNSLDLEQEHQRLTALGAKHSYPEYNPHVTLFEFDTALATQDLVRLQRNIAKANKVLAQQTTLLLFRQQIFSDLKD